MSRPGKKNKAAAKSKRPSAPLTVTRPELLEDGSDRMFREMVHHALAFSARLEALRASYARAVGLSGVEYTILISVAHLQDHCEVGVSTVADHLMLTGAFVTSEINKLVAKGYVDKAINPKDKRRVILTVTHEGAALLSGFAPLQQQANNIHFGTVTKKEFHLLHRLFYELAISTEEALSFLEHMHRSKKLESL